MPYSNKIFVPVVSQIFSYLKPQRLLDVGAGAGKFGRVARSASPQTYTTALEIAQEYIDQFDLASIYDEIRCASLETLFDDVDQAYDVIMFGDVIEHLRKSVGVDLLHFLVYRSRLLILIYPTERLQNSVKGHVQEAHISVWSPHDFDYFDHLYINKDVRFNFVMIRGYLMDTTEFNQLKKHVRQYLPAYLRWYSGITRRLFDKYKTP